MKRFQKILVATDTRYDHHPIVEEAAEIARSNRATLKLVDVVREFSWMSRQVTEDHEHLSDLVAAEKTAKIDALARAVRDKGIDVDSKVLRGKPSVEIIREVIKGEHDLVMAVAKGRNSKRDGFFGQTALRLLRQCPSAVWLVAPDTTPRFKHILGCVDTASDHPLDVELNDKVLELAQSISRYQDSRFSIIHVWNMDDEKILRARMPEEQVDEFVENERRHREERLDAFLKQHDTDCHADNIHLVRGETARTIASFVSDHDIDLLVMGTVGRSGLSGWFMGNTAERILSGIKCSVLAIKPYNFKSSVKLQG